MTRLLAALALLLALALPAGAGESMYEYLQVHQLPPQTCVSPCEVEWSVQLRGLPLTTVVKRCLGGPQIVQDRHITSYFSGAALGEGRLKVMIGDNHPGRTQVFCGRVLYVPLAEEYEHLRGRE